MKVEALSGSRGLCDLASSVSERFCTTDPAPLHPLFSLIVCTRGRTKELSEFLASVINQSGDISCEIILVDQNSDNSLDRIIDAYKERVPITHLRSATGLSRGRNLALQYLQGTFVAFPDDDCVYPKTLLKNVYARLVSLPMAAGLAVMSRDVDGKASGPRWLTKEGWVTKDNVFRQAISYGLFLRARVVQQVGAFDESLGVGAQSSWQSGEETDYILRALAQGLHISYCPSLFCVHAHGNQDERAFQKQIQYAAGGGRVVRLHSFSWAFTIRFFAGPFVRALVSLFRFAPQRSKWQFDLGVARVRGFFSGRVGRVYPSISASKAFPSGTDQTT